MTYNLEINYVIDELDYLVKQLKDGGTDQDTILDAVAIYLEIAEGLDDPSQIGDLY